MRNKTVFVIEPDSTIREALRTLIGTLDYPAECYGDVAAFLKFFFDQRSNDGCLLVESELPELSGLELLRLLRRRGASIPVILLVSMSNPVFTDQALSAGAAQVINKPFLNDCLLETILRLMK